MASSVVDICNIALGYLGANRIAAIEESDVCATNYELCRDACLEDVDWTFACDRFTLEAPAADAPVFGFSYKFLLPSNVLRVISVNDNNQPWEREGNYILIDSASCQVRAVVKVSDVRKFPAAFVAMLAARLAATIAIPITNSKPTADTMWQTFAAMKAEAQGNDGRQGTSRQIRRSSNRRRNSL